MSSVVRIPFIRDDEITGNGYQPLAWVQLTHNNRFVRFIVRFDKPYNVALFNVGYADYLQLPLENELNPLLCFNESYYLNSKPFSIDILNVTEYRLPIPSSAIISLGIQKHEVGFHTGRNCKLNFFGPALFRRYKVTIDSVAKETILVPNLAGI
jgi:hypothetical protein